MYKVLAIIGKAGSGKDTILKQVKQRVWGEQLHEVVSYTTRPKRQGEIEGVNYFFVSNEEFTEMTLDGQMIETSCFNDWLYGTAEASLNPDKVNIAVCNIEGIKSFLEYPDLIDLKVIYVNVADKTRLMRQLTREAEPDIHEIVRRYGTDDEDFKCVVNLEAEIYEIPNETAIDMENAISLVHTLLDKFN